MSIRAKNKKRTYTKSPIKTQVKADRVVMSEAWLKGRRNTRKNWQIKLGDEVIVISGDDAGKIGKVLEVYPAEAKIVVEDVNVQKRHRKLPGQEKGEITEKPAKIWIWKVAHCVEIDGKKVATRIKTNEKKERIAVKTGKSID